MRPLARSSLSARASGIGGGGLGVRHLEHGGDPAQDGGAGPALQVFLPLQAGLAEVDLGVDHAGQDRQALGVEHLARRGLREVADGDDLAGADADVGDPAAGVVHHFAAPDDQVVGLAHLVPVVLASRSRAVETTVSTGRSIM
jgi:hypothetical protein